MSSPDPIHFEEFADDGRLLARNELVDGLPHGKLERFGPSGLPQLNAHYEQGLLDGPFKVFDDDGNLVQEADYSAGKQHGLTRIFSNGRCIAEQHYVHGQLQGESVFYDEGGNLVARQNFRLGKLEGLSQFYSHGVLVRKAGYRAGLLDGECADYDLQGHLVQVANYKANVPHGLTRRFGPDGKLREEILYRDGKPASLPAVAAPLVAPTAPQPDSGLLARLEQFLKG